MQRCISSRGKETGRNQKEDKKWQLAAWMQPLLGVDIESKGYVAGDEEVDLL